MWVPFSFSFRIFYIFFNGTIKKERKYKDDTTYDTIDSVTNCSGYYHRRFRFSRWGNNRAV